MRITKLLAPLIMCLAAPLSIQASELDPDAVWENIANIQGNIESLKEETTHLYGSYENVQSEYESLQEIVAGMEAENQAISDRLLETNELIKYLVTMLEENRTADVLACEDFGQLLGELVGESTERITSVVSGNTVALEEVISGQEIMKTELLEGLSDVSGNTLQVSGDLTNSNTLIICFAMVVVIGLGFMIGMNIMRRFR